MAPKAAAKKVVATKTVKVASRGRVPGSMADRIDTLEVGQSVATAYRFPMDDADTTADAINDKLREMRNGQAAYVGRIMDPLDAREFKVESGTYLTDDKTGIVASVLVTRLE